MNKAKMLKIVNPVLGLSALVQLATAMCMSFLGKIIPGEAVAPVHAINGYFMVCLLAMHLGLNWAWIMTSYIPKKKAA